MVKISDLMHIAGRKTQTKVMIEICDAFNKYAAQYGVDSQLRIAMCLANFAVETQGFTRLEENLNYTTAERIKKVWPSRFATVADAQPFVRNPSGLANKVYGGRMGNGAIPGAGWLYRGSGPGQATGYDAFLEAEQATGIPFTKQPELMRQSDKGMAGALALWHKWGLNDKADRREILAVRKRWNGGTNGLTEVEQAYTRAMQLTLSVPAAQAPVARDKPATEQKPAPSVVPATTPARARKRGLIGWIIAGFVSAGSLLAAKYGDASWWPF